MGLSEPEQTKCCHGYGATQIKRTLFTSEVQRLRMALWSLTRAVGRDEPSDLLSLGNANQNMKMKAEG